MAADNADKAVITDILDNQDRLPAFGVNTPKRIAHFLSQIGHESGGFRISVENLSYTAARMMQVWPSRFPNLEIASQYAHNPEKLGNFVYANRMGNGNAASGDGFRFRGRGLLQLTGRSMYCAVKDFTSLALDQHPEMAELDRHRRSPSTVRQGEANYGHLNDCGNVSLRSSHGRVPPKSQGRLITATVRHPLFSKFRAASKSAKVETDPIRRKSLLIRATLDSDQRRPMRSRRKSNI